MEAASSTASEMGCWNKEDMGPSSFREIEDLQVNRKQK